MSSSTCIVFDEKRCVNCKACEIHCRQWHGISLPLCRQLGGTPALKEGKVSLPMGFVTCVHCARPACLRACTHDAMWLDEENIVHIDADRCTGYRCRPLYGLRCLRDGLSLPCAPSGCRYRQGLQV